MDIRKFSRIAGVSTATVSRAFSGRGRIKKETRTRIFDLATEHGYTPNIHAQRLNASRTSIIAVYYSFSTAAIFDYYNMELAQEISKAAGARGYAVNLELTHRTEEPSEELQRSAAGGGLDGIILVADSREGAAKFLALFKTLPVIVIANHSWELPRAAGIVRISPDIGIAQAVGHLRKQGHARIGFLHGMTDEAKYKAFARALEQCGLSPKKMPRATGPVSFEDGERAVGELLKHPMTALVCSTDILALGAISGAVRRGVRVPQDLAIVGIDNLAFAAFTSPPLASIGIPRAEVAEASVSILDQLVGNKERHQQSSRQFVHTVNTHFIPRASAQLDLASG